MSPGRFAVIAAVASLPFWIRAPLIWTIRSPERSPFGSAAGLSYVTVSTITPPSPGLIEIPRNAGLLCGAASASDAIAARRTTAVRTPQNLAKPIGSSQIDRPCRIR